MYVYRLRQDGRRRSRAEMRKEGLRGNLQLLPTSTGWPPKTWLLAALRQPGSQADLLPCIEHAKVVRIRDALTIRGIESVSRGRKKVEKWPQTWVCSVEPIQPEAWPEPSGRTMLVSSGFDPADDDR